jgi:hypothetical protein
MTAATHPIVGTWKLIRYWSQYDGGEKLYPLGADARGYITYTQAGFMSGTMQRAAPPPFAVADRLQATPAEKGRAFEDYVTYCGRWEADGDDMIHHIELSLLPNWIGESQRRHAVWHGPDRVDLVGSWQIGDKRRSAIVEWERAK